MLKNPWARNPWFETVAVAQRRAQKRLPASVYGALLARTPAKRLTYRALTARSL